MRLWGQDLPRLMAHSDAKVSYVKLERFFSYTPVKNGVKQGAVQADKGLPPMTPSSGEADLYAANRELLRLGPRILKSMLYSDCI